MIYEASCRFCCQTATSVGRNDCIADLYHARFIGFALVTARADEHSIFGVNKKICPPTKRIRIGFEVFIEKSHSSYAHHTGEIEPVIEHSDTKHLLDLLLVF